MSTGEKFQRAVNIMARLRAPGGCPWDREQTFDTITRYTLEETYEVLEAIEKKDWDELPSELGDLLLQVLFYSEMGREQGLFSIDNVLDALSNKLIGRHPHVFGDVKAEDAQQVLKNWEALKKEERRKRVGGNGNTPDEQMERGTLDHVSSHMPALMEAQKLSSKAAHTGFDWPNIEELFEKLAEETAELQQQIQEVPQGAAHPDSQMKVPEHTRRRIQDEVGDMFFVLVNIARYLSVDPESALRSTNRKFRRRFGWMEEKLRAQGKALEDVSMEEMEALWQQAKQLEQEEQQR